MFGKLFYAFLCFWAIKPPSPQLFLLCPFILSMTVVSAHKMCDYYHRFLLGEVFLGVVIPQFFFFFDFRMIVTTCV